MSDNQEKMKSKLQTISQIYNSSNFRLMTKDLASIQNELMDMKRKNVDLQQRLDIFHYKMGEDNEMVSSTHSNSSAGTRSIHEPVFPADRVTPERKFFPRIINTYLFQVPTQMVKCQCLHQ
jgi:hypothetical protein